MKNILIMVFIIFAGWKFYTASEVKVSKQSNLNKLYKALKQTKYS